MSESLPFLEKILRVTHSHIAHRAQPPTRFEPWTNRDKESDAYRQYIGYRVINTESEDIAYCYLVPDFDAPIPQLRVYYGPAGDPAIDTVVATVEVGWYGGS
jgi:PhoPQ-activated pathogenicity-related protein